MYKHGDHMFDLWGASKQYSNSMNDWDSQHRKMLF